MVHQHLRLTHTHTQVAVVSIMLLPISILSTGNLCGGHQSPNWTKMWYECHPCMLSITQTEASMMMVFRPPLPNFGCPAQWHWGTDMEWLHLRRVFLHKISWSSIILLPPLQTFTRLLLSLLLHLHYYCQWQMHSINGIMLISVPLPAGYLREQPFLSHLASNGRNWCSMWLQQGH